MAILVNYKRIGENIQKARKLLGMSVADLSETVHFTPKSIIYAESGQAALSLEFLLGLCAALDVTPNDLLAGEFQCNRKGSLEQDATLDELKKMIESMKEEMGVETPGNGTVIKDTETVLDEFRRTVIEYQRNPPKPEPKKKKAAHW